MESTCVTPTCDDSCANQLPPISFSLCAPTIKFGQVAKMYLWNDGYPLTNENDLTEWQERVNLPLTDPARILEFSLIGDVPLPTATEVPISRGRIATGLSEFILNITIDDNNDVNYEFARKTQCGSFTKRIAYETYDGDLYGGREGILGTLRLAEDTTANFTDIRPLKGTFKWKNKFSPCRTASPMAGIELLAVAGS